MGEQRLSTDPDCKQSEDEDGDPICAPAAQVIKIEESILHPEFSREPGAPNDIALLRLSKPAVLGSKLLRAFML